VLVSTVVADLVRVDLVVQSMLIGLLSYPIYLKGRNEERRSMCHTLLIRKGKWRE
jgi:hypothetical protein